MGRSLESYSCLVPTRKLEPSGPSADVAVARRPLEESAAQEDENVRDAEAYAVVPSGCAVASSGPARCAAALTAARTVEAADEALQAEGDDTVGIALAEVVVGSEVDWHLDCRQTDWARKRSRSEEDAAVELRDAADQDSNSRGERGSSTRVVMHLGTEGFRDEGQTAHRFLPEGKQKERG